MMSDLTNLRKIAEAAHDAFDRQDFAFCQWDTVV